jgi:hypothetical protein
MEKKTEYYDELLNIPESEVGKKGIAFDGGIAAPTLLVHKHDWGVVFSTLDEEEFCVQKGLNIDEVKTLVGFLQSYIDEN